MDRNLKLMSGWNLKSKISKVDLTGKWKYKEDYGYGVAEGELFLKQEGNDLSGRIIFTDKLDGEDGYMLQEFLVGRLEEHKVKLDA